MGQPLDKQHQEAQKTENYEWSSIIRSLFRMLSQGSVKRHLGE